MKIGLVSPYDYAYPGGVMAHIFHLSQHLVAAGHEIKIIAPLTSPPAILDKGFIRLGRSFSVPTGGSVARISLSVWLEPRIKRLLAEEQFDVIHLHEPLAPVIPLYILRLSDAVNVGTFHAFHGSGRVYWASKYMLRRWHSRLDGCIAVSTPALSMVSRHFPGDYRVIPNGIEFSRFATPARPLTDFQDGKLNILFVGRLEKRKGLKYLLGAYSKLKWRHPNTRLIVVGPGNPEPEVFRFIAERNLEDVVLVGGVSYEDLPRYYQAADIFCSPATGKESFGIVLLEAMASGKPIVATSIEGYSSVMSHGEEGLLVPPRSEEALQVALETLISDPALREEMGARGASKAPRYDWERVTAQIIDYYTYLLERRSAGQSADLAEPREDLILP
ncbi:MAG: glycosyltransferase family 4 protein [Chloroflexota bacterium]|nr:glycosyltransferase family 4 protein [Chloroflexota bacterium]MDE2941070.1 glycosyltransferase family 4 protein [Chloroflexota bacterium]MDE3267404.1 glycosyltransferase family 4 protein [Chloroflexota bacterium]